MQGRVVIHSNGSGLVTILKISPSKFESLIRDTWRKHYDDIKEWWTISYATTNIGLNLNSFNRTIMEKAKGTF